MIKFATFLSFGLLLLIMYYYYGKIKAGRFVLKKTFIGRLSKKYAPKENTTEYIKTTEKLTKALSTLDVIDITAIKLATIFATIILSAAIFLTNSTIQIRKIYATPIYSMYSSNAIYNNAAVRKHNVKIVKKRIGFANINNTESSKKIIKKVISSTGEFSSQELDQMALITMSDISKIKNVYSIPKILIYLLMGLSGIYMADLILYLYFKSREKHINEESIQLMNILTIVLSTSIMPINAVITMLIENSHYLKEILQNFFMAYMVNSEEAYNLYLVKTGNKSFEKVIGILKQIEESDQKETIRDIKNQNASIQALERIQFETIIEKKDGIALIILTIGVTFLIKFIVDYCMLLLNSSDAMF